MRVSQVLSYALLSTTVSAWSLQELRDNKAVQGVEGMFRRADSSDTTSASTTTSSTTKSKASSAESTTTDDSKSSTDSAQSSGSSGSSATTKASGSTGSVTSTGTITGSKTTGTSKTTGSSGTTGNSTTKTYGNSVGYGGISMISPNPLSSSSYYKVGNWLTFAWNMTSLSITPTAIDILATCTANSATYTISMNKTIDGSSGTVLWDTNEYEASATPLLTETYTLMIHDAARDVTATAPYGGLAAYTQFVFEMYTPQPYTALASGWQCVTCSGAISQSERQTFGFIFGMAAITVLSFTWFAGSFGVF